MVHGLIVGHPGNGEITVMKYIPHYVVALVLAIIAAASIYYTADVLDVGVKKLTRDPYRAANVKPYLGYFSLVGSSIWLIGGTATLAIAVFLRRVLGCRFSDESPYRIIVMGGVIGFVMALDDILLFHDAWAKRVDVSEGWFNYTYVLGFLGLLILSRKVLRQTPWPILFASLACFGISSGIDNAFPPIMNDWFSSNSEDVFKICGVVLWAYYFLHVCWAYPGKGGSTPELGDGRS